MFVAENCSSKFLGSIKLRPRSVIELAQGPLVRPPCSIHDLLCGDSRHRCCCGRSRPSRMSSKLWIQPCLLQGYLKAPCRRYWLVRRNQRQEKLRSRLIGSEGSSGPLISLKTSHRTQLLSEITTGCKDFSFPGLVCLARPLHSNTTPSGV